MKKILLLCSIAFMLSCSNDAETQSTNVENVTTTTSKSLPPVENDTDQIFYEYVTSDVYLQIVHKLREFQILRKLPQEIEFQSSIEMFSWIEANIHLTDFESIEDAQNRWTEIVDLQQIEINQFPAVYEFIGNADEAVILPIFNKWLTTTLTDPPKVVPATPCDKKFDECSNAANFAYFNTSRSFSDDPNKMANAKDKQMKDLDKCTNAYVDCINK